MFTRLGENVTRPEEGDAVAEHYLGLLDTIAERGLDGEVSVKLTQLGYDLDRDRTLAHVERLAENAAGPDRPDAVGRHGGQRLRRRHDRALRAPPGDPPEHRPLPPGVPPPDRGRHPAPPAARPRPSGSSRAPTPSRRRSPTRSRHDVDANYVALAVAMLEGDPGRADGARSGSGRTTSG